MKKTVNKRRNFGTLCDDVKYAFGVDAPSEENCIIMLEKCNHIIADTIKMYYGLGCPVSNTPAIAAKYNCSICRVNNRIRTGLKIIANEESIGARMYEDATKYLNYNSVFELLPSIPDEEILAHINALNSDFVTILTMKYGDFIPKSYKEISEAVGSYTINTMRFAINRALSILIDRISNKKIYKQEHCYREIIRFCDKTKDINRVYVDADIINTSINNLKNAIDDYDDLEIIMTRFGIESGNSKSADETANMLGCSRSKVYSTINKYKPTIAECCGV